MNKRLVIDSSSSGLCIRKKYLKLECGGVVLVTLALRRLRASRPVSKKKRAGSGGACL